MTEVKIKGFKYHTDFWIVLAWCRNELGYVPRTQANHDHHRFIFRSESDAVAFKIRWS